MKKIIETIGADRVTRFSTFISLGLIFLAIIYIGIMYRALPPFLPLFNQMGWGDPRLADKAFIFLLPLLAFFILLCNTIFETYFYAAMPLVSRMMAITNLLVSALTIIFIIRVTQLLV